MSIELTRPYRELFQNMRLPCVQKTRLGPKISPSKWKHRGDVQKSNRQEGQSRIMFEVRNTNQVGSYTQKQNPHIQFGVPTRKKEINSSRSKKSRPECIDLSLSYFFSHLPAVDRWEPGNTHYFPLLHLGSDFRLEWLESSGDVFSYTVWIFWGIWS